MDGNFRLDEDFKGIDIDFLLESFADDKMREFFVSQLECLIGRYREYSNPKNSQIYKEVIDDLQTILDQAEETKNAYNEWGRDNL